MLIGTLTLLSYLFLDIAINYVPHESSYLATLDLSEHNIETFLGLKGKHS